MPEYTCDPPVCRINGQTHKVENLRYRPGIIGGMYCNTCNAKVKMREKK